MRKNKILTLKSVKEITERETNNKELIKKHLKFVSIHLGIFTYLTQCKLTYNGEDTAIYCVDLNLDEVQKKLKNNIFLDLEIKYIDEQESKLLTSVCIDINKSFMYNLKYCIETIKNECNLNQVFKQVKL